MILLNYSSSSRRRARRILLLTAAFVAPGCQLAFGTYSGNVSQDTGGAGGAATGGMATYGGASAGGDTTGAGGAAGSGGCDTATGNCPKCSTSDPSRCGDTTDAGTPLLACEHAAVGFITSDICISPKFCVPGVNHCVICVANAVYCQFNDAGTLSDQGKVCNDDQTGWNYPTCQNGGCVVGQNGSPDRCDLCNDGDTVCIPAAYVVRTCVEGQWQTESCGSLGCQPASGQNPAVCIK